MKAQNLLEKRSLTLILLCVLTILGNLLIILKGLVTYYVLDSTKSNRREDAIAFINGFYVLEFLTCAGAILGAILMLAGKRKGLLVYQISSVLYIMMTLALACLSFLSIVGIPLGFLQFLYLIPSVAFFVLYKHQEKYLS